MILFFISVSNTSELCPSWYFSNIFFIMPNFEFLTSGYKFFLEGVGLSNLIFFVNIRGFVTLVLMVNKFSNLLVGIFCCLRFIFLYSLPLGYLLGGWVSNWGVAF